MSERVLTMNSSDWQSPRRRLYPDGTRYLVLLSGSGAALMMEDWLDGGWRCDLRARRAKTEGKIVLETTDLVFASRMVIRNPGCKVSIITPKPPLAGR